MPETDHGARSILHTLRSTMNLTQEELADRSGITVRQIRNLEAGKVSHPRPHTLVALAHALALTSTERDLFVAHFQERAWSRADMSDAAAPRQLPPRSPDFTGRDAELERLRSYLHDAEGIGVALVVGLGGIGKTTLAVEACMREVTAFPDGQLYAHLIRPDGTPKSAADVLPAFLRALGADTTKLPNDSDELAALWRSTAADRRLVVLFDDATSEKQVRELLPGGPSAVLVTSRSALGGLDAALRLRLQPLDPASAEQLFRQVCRLETDQAESATVRRLTEACAGHPLALRLLATRVALRPQLPIESLADWVEVDGHRLDSLASGDRAVAAALAASLDLLDPESRSTLRLLAATGTSHIRAWQVAAIDGHGLIQAEDLLERLVGGGLLETAQTRGQMPRYRLHDLVREYLVSEGGVPLSAEAVVRLSAVAASLTSLVVGPSVARPVPHVLTPAMPESFEAVGVPLSAVDARAWFDDEVDDLHAVLTLACRTGDARAAGGLLAALRPALTRTGRLDMLAEAAAACITVSAADPLAEACALLAAASVDAELGRHRRAASNLERALDQLAGADACTVGGAWYELGWVRQHLGEVSKAEQAYLQAIALHRSIGNDFGELGCCLALAELYANQDPNGEPVRAQLRRANQIADTVSDHRTQVKTLLSTAAVLRIGGDVDEVRGLLQRARTLAAAYDDDLLVLSCLCAAAATERTIGNVDEAIRASSEARDRAVELGRRVEEAVALTELGHAQLAANRRPDAYAAWRHAWQIRVALGHEEHCRDLEIWMESTEPSTTVVI